MPYNFKVVSTTLGGPKSASCPVECDKTVTFCQKIGLGCFQIDTPGNIFYAHIGRFAGFSENVLQLGSQFAQLTSSKGPSWDPPNDTRLINIGFSLPDPLTRADLCTAVMGAIDELEPQPCGNCPEQISAVIKDP